MLNAAVLPSFLSKNFAKNPRLKTIMQKSTKKIKKKAGKLKLKKWIRDRSIVSSIKQNFEVESLVLFMRK